MTNESNLESSNEDQAQQGAPCVNKPANPCEQTYGAHTNIRPTTGQKDFYDSPTLGDS